VGGLPLQVVQVKGQGWSFDFAVRPGSDGGLAEKYELLPEYVQVWRRCLPEQTPARRGSCDEAAQRSVGCIGVCGRGAACQPELDDAALLP
jgi:hypothetical protein